MMLHSLCKESSALLCEAVQGEFLNSVTYCIQFTYNVYEIARIDNDDHGFEQDHWKKFYKNMGKNLDEPEQSGQLQSF